MDVGPRNKTAGCAPGRPLFDTISAPGTFPWSWVRGLAAGTGICERSIRLTANGTLAASVACCTPVTTTASSRFTSVASVKSWVCSPACRTIGRADGL